MPETRWVPAFARSPAAQLGAFAAGANLWVIEIAVGRGGKPRQYPT